MKLVGVELHVACENSHFFLLLAAFDILQGGTSGTQQQKFHTDDVNQCLHTVPLKSKLTVTRDSIL